MGSSGYSDEATETLAGEAAEATTPAQADEAKAEATTTNEEDSSGGK